MRNIINELRLTLNTGGAYIKLVTINVAVYIAINIISLITFLFGFEHQFVFKYLSYLAVPASFASLLYKPWTLVTYMFIHQDFFHILFNMLMFFFSGKVFQDFYGEKKLTITYLIGGIAGALFYIMSYNSFPAFQNAVSISFNIGASASILAITIALATMIPNMEVHLFLFGRVKLKYLAIVLVLIDLLSIEKGNPGGHLAHIGGALWGFIFASQLKSGRNLTKWLEEIDFNKYQRSKLKVVHKKPLSDDEFNANKKNKQEKMDEILDKISKSGYESLTKQEKEILFKLSNDKHI